MTELKIVHLDAREHHGTALIDTEDGVWIALAPSWWDIASWIWWFFCPIDRQAHIHMNTKAGKKVRVRAVRVAKRHVRFRGVPKTEMDHNPD